jgi:hypothetical protein
MTQDARFRTVHLLQSEVPFGRLYFCQHDTRDLVWRAEWQRHPNGAREIIGLLFSAADPAGFARLFARLFGAEAVPVDDGRRLRLAVGPVAIDIAGHETVLQQLGNGCPQRSGRHVFMAAIRLKTSSLRQAADAIGAAAGASRRGDRLVVPAPAAFNVALEFVE